MTLKMPNGRPFHSGLSLNKHGRICQRERPLTTQEISEMTGASPGTIKRRMRIFGMTLVEAFHVTPPKKGRERVSNREAYLHLDWFRPWFTQTFPAIIEGPAPNGPEVQPMPKEPEPPAKPQQLALPLGPGVLRIEVVIVPAGNLGEMHVRMDHIEGLLHRLVSVWGHPGEDTPAQPGESNDQSTNSKDRH